MNIFQLNINNHKIPKTPYTFEISPITKQNQHHEISLSKFGKLQKNNLLVA